MIYSNFGHYDPMKNRKCKNCFYCQKHGRPQDKNCKTGTCVNPKGQYKKVVQLDQNGLPCFSERKTRVQKHKLG